MRPDRARRLVRLYPRHWRQRYGEEFQAMLESGQGGLLVIADVFFGAIKAHAANASAIDLDAGPREVVLLGWACLASFAAIANTHLPADDAFLIAMSGDPVLSTAFAGLTLAAVLAVLAAVWLTAAILYRLAASAGRDQRWQLVKLLGAPLVVAVATVAWITAAVAIARAIWGGDWVPVPWEIGTDFSGAGPPSWVRWTGNLATLALLLFGLAITASGVKKAMARFVGTYNWSRASQAGAITLAMSIAVMAAVAFVWEAAALRGGAPFVRRSGRILGQPRFGFMDR